MLVGLATVIDPAVGVAGPSQCEPGDGRGIGVPGRLRAIDVRHAFLRRATVLVERLDEVAGDERFADARREGDRPGGAIDGRDLALVLVRRSVLERDLVADLELVDRVQVDDLGALALVLRECSAADAHDADVDRPLARVGVDGLADGDPDAQRVGDVEARVDRNERRAAVEASVHALSGDADGDMGGIEWVHRHLEGAERGRQVRRRGRVREIEREAAASRRGDGVDGLRAIGAVTQDRDIRGGPRAIDCVDAHPGPLTAGADLHDVACRVPRAPGGDRRGGDLLAGDVLERDAAVRAAVQAVVGEDEPGEAVDVEPANVAVQLGIRPVDLRPRDAAIGGLDAFQQAGGLAEADPTAHAARAGVNRLAGRVRHIERERGDRQRRELIG